MLAFRMMDDDEGDCCYYGNLVIVEQTTNGIPDGFAVIVVGELQF